MRIFFFILFIFTSIISFSHVYHFDYFIKEKTTGTKPKKIEWFDDWFYNTKTGEKLSIKNENNKIIAILYPIDQRIKHIFKVNKIKDQNYFIYKYSRQVNLGDTPARPYKGKEVFDIKQLDSLHYNFVVFKNSQRKKKEIDAIIKLEIGEFDYIDFGIDYIITFDGEIQLKRILNPEYKYFIKSTEYRYNSKFSTTKSVELIQKVDLILNVPSILKEPANWSDFED